MLKASNNHFGARSEIKIQKIRSFFNLKRAKITRKYGKIFLAPILPIPIELFRPYISKRQKYKIRWSHVCYHL